MVHVFFAFSAVDLEGDQVCRIVVTTDLGKLWIFLAYVQYLMAVGLDQLSSRLELAALALCLRFVGMKFNGHSPPWGPNTVQLD